MPAADGLPYLAYHALCDVCAILHAEILLLQLMETCVTVEIVMSVTATMELLRTLSKPLSL